jgi:hypothetical protein
MSLFLVNSTKLNSLLSPAFEKAVSNQFSAFSFQSSGCQKNDKFKNQDCFSGRMSLVTFSKHLSDLKKSVESFRKCTDKTLSDFKQTMPVYYDSVAKSKIKMIKKAISDMVDMTDEKEKIEDMLELIDIVASLYSSKQFEKINEKVDRIAEIVKSVKFDEVISLDVNLPPEISKELNADFNEMHKCFKAGFFRATIILCGRILEAALLRKYYEVTKKDLLETSPGIGLGKVIAKLKEAGIDLGPGLNEQIHLINNIRISSVHKQKQLFKPSREQANAIILYTTDALNKIFS